MISLPRVHVGDAITAERWNALVDLVEAALTVRAGSGIAAQAGEGGLLLTLLGRKDTRGMWVKITAVHVSGGSPSAPDFPSRITYDVASLDRGWSKAGLSPVYGRPVRNDECKIYACPVGRMAFVLRNPQEDGGKVAELFVFDEVTAKGPC